MKFHPISNIFPLLPDKELDVLAADIKSGGLHHPITLLDGKILDGRNRYLACKLAKVKPSFEKYVGDNPLAFVIGENVKRRHLNESQRAMCAARLANMRQGNFSKAANLPLSQFSQSAAAEMLNVGERSIRSAKTVLDSGAPELVQAVDNGEMTVNAVLKEIKAKKVRAEREKVALAGRVGASDRWHVYQDDMESWAALRQYDFIITDPPYPKEYLPLYETLAIRSNEWLKDGGLLVVMCGQSYLDQIYAAMSKHTAYYWTAAYLTPGQPTPLRQINVNTTWKPLLIFRKGEYTGRIFGDVFTSEASDKDFHEWGQSESGMHSIISGMCLPGQSILDPFCGAGTTLVAAVKHGCLADGLDIDIGSVNIARGRLASIHLEGDSL